jgi:GTP-binding protein
VLVDSRHGIKEIDREVMTMLDEAAVSYHLVLTKADKNKASDLAQIQAETVREAARRPAAHPEVIATSSETGLGIERLRRAVLEAVI